MSAFIIIKINGTVLPGVSSFNAFAGVSLDNHTQIYSFYTDTNVAQGNHSGVQQQGRIEVSPYAFLKPLDGISPMLRQAFFSNHVFEATIKIFGRDPDTGQPRFDYDIELKNARIVGIRQEMQQPLSGGDGDIPPMERILIASPQIKDRSHLSNFSYQYTLGGQA